MNYRDLIVTALAISIISTTAQAAKYKTIDVANGGSISGKVTFKGKVPGPKVYKITKNNDVCGNGDRAIDFVKVNNGALNDVVVFLAKVKAGKPFDAAEDNGNLNQEGCAFLPFIQVMHNNNELAALNSDPVLHNIHTYEMIGRAKKTVINVSQPDQGSTYKKKISLKRGNAMKIECDAHDFMHGFVFVAKNPYYALVAKDGSYQINDVPPGKYKIIAWHGVLKNQKSKVTVAAGKSAQVNFEFKK